MSDENTETSMLIPPAATETRVVVIRRWIVIWNSWKLYAILAFLSAVIVICNLAVGLLITCDSDNNYCNSYHFIVGSCFIPYAACFLVFAIVKYKKRNTAIMLEQSSSVEQPVTVTPLLSASPSSQHVQYPPPYHPSTGPNNPLSPAANQYSPPAGFTASPQPPEAYLQEATKPPPYSP